MCYCAYTLTFEMNCPKHLHTQVRVGLTEVTRDQQSSPITANAPCGLPLSHGAEVNDIYTYTCIPSLSGQFVTVQKLDTSQSGDAIAFGINEIEIFHEGKECCNAMVTSSLILIFCRFSLWACTAYFHWGSDGGGIVV